MSNKKLQHALLAVAASLAIVACGSDSQPPPAVEATEPLNDTGAATCVDSTGNATPCTSAGIVGQDALYGRDAAAVRGELAKTGRGNAGFDFVRLDAEGNALTSASGDWACVQDQVTGLTWEVKTGEAGSTRHFNHTYSWYNSDAAANGGVPGSEGGGQCQGTACDTAAYIAAINQLGLCGRINWRLPSVNEMLSIIDHGRINPPLDTDFFPNASLNAHWTSQTVAENPENVWYVYFTVGTSGQISKGGRAHIRLVSSAQP